MNAIILAAGRGSRLKGFTEDKPKCLNKVASCTLLEHQIRALKEGGIEDIVIVTGYKAKMLETFSSREYRNDVWEQTNMVVSLLCAKQEFDQPAIVSYSDIIYKADDVKNLIKQKQDMVIAYDENWRSLWEKRFDNPLDDAESFIINKDYRMTELGKRVSTYEKIQGQYMGLMRFSQKAFKQILDFTDSFSEHEINKMDMTTLLGLLMKNEYPVYGMPIQESWCEIDTVRDFEVANKIFKG